MKSKKFVLAGLALLAITMVLLPLSGCKNDSVSETHTHTFDETKWESDATGHWHPVICGHTEEKGGFASHTFGDWEVEESSATVKKVVEVCVECHYAQEVTDFVYIPAGTFQMGSNVEGVNEKEKPAHDVTISKGYFMGRHEVTQQLYEAVMGKNPSGFKTGAEDEEPKEGLLPVESVSWYDAVVFCNELSELMKLEPVYSKGSTTDTSKWGEVPDSSNKDWDEITCNWNANGYRLPREAEWEYAARAGDATTNARTWSGTDTQTKLEEYAWYTKNSGNEAGEERKTHQVGTLAPNEWGLYDMSGNVWEWCWDWYDKNYYSSSSTESVTNPTGPTGGSSDDSRVVRGGSWGNYADFCTVSYRGCNVPSIRNNYLGFRLVRSAN